MSLNIEMCMLGLTFGACFASIFGMNLKSSLEDHPYAFYLTVSSIIVSSTYVLTPNLSLEAIHKLCTCYQGNKNYSSTTHKIFKKDG